ncbi:MAG: ChbG/HpnK family deacetylase [Syntrophobacteraceae bacterium]
MQCRLIINGDDFGLTRGVNSAISECAAIGPLRSATLMANGEAFDHAVAMAKERSNLGVGIHFALTNLKPILPPDSIPELAGKDGLLPARPAELLKRIATGKRILDEIRRELLAQTERVFSSGITPTHFDSHKHVHMIPAVLDIIIGIARRFSVKWIRNPYEAGSLRLLADIEPGETIHFLKQYAGAQVSRFGQPFFRASIRRSGIRTPDRFLGVSVTGLMNERILERLCGMLRPGVNELMTHPGMLDADLLSCKTRLLHSRQKERELLISEHLKELLRQKGVTLGHYGEVD